MKGGSSLSLPRTRPSTTSSPLTLEGLFFIKYQYMPTVLVASKIGTKMKKQRVCKTNSLSKMNKEEERIRRIKQARINQIKEIELVIE